MIHIIFIFDIILLLCFIAKLFLVLTRKTTTFDKFKIINKYLSFVVITTYIILFILGLFFYRFYSMGNFLDLRLVYDNFYFLSINLPLQFKVYFGVIILLMWLSFSLILLNLHKYACLEIYKVFIFMNYKTFFRNHEYTRTLYNYISSEFHCNNIISVLLNLFAWNSLKFLKAMKVHQGVVYQESEMPSYLYYELVVAITDHRFLNKKLIYTFDVVLYFLIPSLLFIYDCIFNDLLISKIFYYLPFSLGLLLIQRVTTTIALSDRHIQDLLWEIYYGKDSCIYLALDKQRLIFDYFLMNGLRLPLELPGDLNRVFISQTLHILNDSPLHYRLVKVGALLSSRTYYLYQNDFGDYAHETLDKKFFFVEDYDIVNDQLEVTYGEELTIIIDKRKNESTNSESN